MKNLFLMMVRSTVLTITLFCVINLNGQNTVLAKYDFNSVQDVSGNYIGNLKNGAQLVTYGDNSVLSLGDSDGYFDFGANFGAIISQLENFSISTNLYISNSYDSSGNGNFVWTFANSTDMVKTANGNLFFNARNSRYSISKTNYTAESSVIVNNSLPKGRWINLIYTQQNGIGKIFINGSLMAESSITITPKELGNTAYNFLGRSCYLADKYLETAIFDNFIVYNGALNDSEIQTLGQDIISLNSTLNTTVLAKAAEELIIPNATTVNSNLLLNTDLGNQVTVKWVSSNTSVISDTGIVTRMPIDSSSTNVTLEATLSCYNATITKQFAITVLPFYSDAQSIQLDLANLTITGNLRNIRTSIHLPIKTEEGAVIIWTSDSPDFLNNIGKVVQLSPLGNGKKKVTLTATLLKGQEKSSRTFEVWVAEEEDRSSYLFAYFTGNNTDGEQIRFSVSNDGYNYTPLNNGLPILNSDLISIKKGVRDPHILRGEDGNTFYMVATDMKSSEGWSSNRGIVLLKSNDLTNWTHSTVNFPTKWPAAWGNVLRVWAPQTIFDPIAGKYMVYFSLYTGAGANAYDKIYYCYVNEDFTDLIGTPELLFDRGTASIDGDIVLDEVDGLYHMFFKNESLGGISQVISTTLTAAIGQEPGSQWSQPSLPLQQTTEAVEGSGVFRLINTNQWVLMYDCYSNGHYQYSISSNLKDFKFVQDNYNISARHGTTIAISDAEAARLITKWPSTNLYLIPEGARNKRIRSNGVEINNTNKTVKLAVDYGTDLTNFDPMLYASPGTKILPEGFQDFSNGEVKYQIIKNGEINTYSVVVNIEVNPIIPSFHADPEVLYSEKTRRFYIYPTTDGYQGWGGYTFDVFSSPDLVNWTNEGTILDLKTDQVSWSTGNAWAPSIVEKKIDNSYKYFFYFSGNTGTRKEIGVAVSNDPTGPFKDSGSTIISQLPSGINGGQLIDGAVFKDPISSKSYFYWGNGFMAVAELNDDMVTIKPNTTSVITPSGGSLNTYQYREGTNVFYRNGLYYFLWSVDDTGSANYHVAYGTSTSPTGPINVANQPIVIIQDESNKIYGTGHNSIIQIPGRDEWYIIYHRINADHINSDPGIHREVCIDRLNFNNDGSIIKITPTKRGIDPVILDHISTKSLSVSDVNHIKDSELIKEEIYSLTGAYFGNNIKKLKNGIYIIRSVYENGSVSVRKILKTITN
ncbi:family 43 glycosylhydrolase [Flavobacterium cellulosilyticum]|uniref:Atrophied bacterial Ig domain-containing protein n=1 Tax=Flavobacterium cellulosilyticum TaxID=2541731 RepID=A0A4R5CAY3_9FLAO|nr:family 43 glycosylhydrolase [Flavobacterium cellulosilyticum]TDD94222.1 hypothetical protein E0F76_17420 [Flavobacterium cellulosilyticum]